MSTSQLYTNFSPFRVKWLLKIENIPVCEIFGISAHRKKLKKLKLIYLFRTIDEQKYNAGAIYKKRTETQ